ncbi:uncharacterized protein N7459_009786 [Penicillium hispanicum]|uniref:uncharacterized protein n=1 Tax=Penicillium hispanicum TaxID=1080232 RepID=UPI002540F36F|nr:uncharacterized protein N7459_009786 [Penicillium hispanicum]KAJ5570356.1 hypothetical protein N7459_009786 [Penicillium hispanicum]
MDHKEIRAVHSVLHLIYHRNKNQHRQAKWWRWLSLLKRTTLKLGSLDTDTSAVSRQHLARQVVPRCYLAFSSVVAENQFAALGIVLLSTLARLVKATGINQELKTRPQSRAKTLMVAVVEDRGERVDRADVDAPPRLSKAPEPISGTPEKSSTRASTKRSRKSNKRKQNAIDDLFSGFL